MKRMVLTMKKRDSLFLKGVVRMKQVAIVFALAIATLIFTVDNDFNAQVGGGGHPDPGKKEQSKIPSIVQESLYELAGGGTAVYDDMLPAVDHEGRIQLEFHAAGAVGSTEKADLESLGAIVELSTGDLVLSDGLEGLGVIVAWIPYSQVEAAAALPWVVVVRPVDRAPPDVVS